MREDEAFLQNIQANPRDRLARLVYADWLDENGQPERAEFLRIQCEVVSSVERLVEVGPSISKQWINQIDLFYQTFTLFQLPTIGECPRGTMITGVTVSKVHVQPCQRLSAGSDLVDVETEKAYMGLPVQEECVVLALLVEVGQHVPVGGSLALLLRV